MHRSLTKVPLRTVLIVAFVGQMTVAVGLTAWLSIRNGQKAVHDVALLLLDEVSTLTRDRIPTYLETPQQLNTLHVNDVDLKHIDITGDVRTLSPHLVKSLQTFDQVSFTVFANPQGQYIGARRAADGSLQIGVIDDATDDNLRYYSTNEQGDFRQLQQEINLQPGDVLKRPWYKAAVKAQAPTWSEVYITRSTEGLGITAARPVYGDRGELLGVFSSTIALEIIDQFLEPIKVGQSGQVFILDSEGRLIATSTGERLYRVVNRDDVATKELIQATDSQNSLTRAAAKALLDPVGHLATVNMPQKFELFDNHERNFVEVTPLTEYAELDWRIVVVAPEADFMAQIYANTRRTIWLCLGALALATGSSILTARWITQPLLQLNQAAKDITEGSPQSVQLGGAIAPHRTREVSELSHSFSQMTQQLQASLAAVQQSEAAKQAVLDAIPDLLIWMRADGTCEGIAASDQVIDLLPPGTAVGDNQYDALPPSLAELRRQAIAEATRTGQIQHYEQVIDFDGSKQYEDVRVVPLGADRVLVVVRNISDLKAAEQALKIQRDFNELVANITSRFVDLSPTHLDAEIERSLQQIGETTRVDTSFVFKFDRQTQTLSMTHQWCQPDYPPTRAQAQNIPIAGFPWGMAVLKRREVVYVPWVADLPDEAEIDRTSWQRFNITSVLVVPLVQNSEVTGFLGFAAHRERIIWQEEIVRLLQVMGQTIANAQESAQTQADLIASEARWQFALEGSGDGVWDWNVETNEVFFSRQWKTMLGYGEHEIGNGLEEWDSRVHPDDKAHYYEALEQHFTGQTPIYQNEHRVRCKDNSYRWILDRGKVIEWTADGKPLRVIGTHTDITDRKQAETQLQDLTNRLGLAARSAHMGIWEWDIVSDRLIWDDRMYELYGIHADDFSEASAAWKAGVHPDDLAPSNWAVQQALSGEKDFSMDLRVVWPDGTTHYLEAHAVVQRDAAGQPLQMIGVSWDISDRKALEQDLLEQQRLLDAFVTSSPVAKCIMDCQLRYTLINNALAEINGVPAADHIGKTPWDIVPDIADQQAAIIRQVLATGEAVLDFEVVGETKKMPGVIRTWSASYFPLMPSAGSPIGIGMVVIETTARNRAEQALRESELKFRQLAENIQEVFWLTDAEIGQIIFVSAAYEDIWGRSRESLYANPTSFVEAIHPDDRPLLRQILSAPNSAFEVEYRVVQPDGTIRWVWDRGFPIFENSGQLTRRAGLAQDITERKRVETQLQDLTDRLALAIQAADMGIWEWDMVNDHLIWDKQMFALYNLRPEDFSNIYAAWQARVHPEDLPAVNALEQQGWANRQDYASEFRIIWPDGTIRHIASFALVQRDAEGKPVRIVGANLDISDRKQAEEQLIYSALHDALTDLPNRAFLTGRLESALQRAHRSDTYHFALLFLDLDQFKVINDSLGHLIGDELLMTVAQKLTSIIRPTDSAARLGGDEFVILLEHIPDIQAVIHMAERLLAEFEGATVIDGHSVFVTTSIGIVWGTNAYTNAADLLRDADIALYRAKARGRGRYEIFDGEMHIQAVKRMTLEHDLRIAIDQQELITYYQPIVDLKTQRLTGFEALIRWHHPTRGFISPADFIPVAEETGLIMPITRWMLRSACGQVASWQRQFPDMEDLRVSVNLSGKDLRQPTLLETIRQILSQTQLPATSLTLEITESMLIDKIENTIELLKQLRELGIRISIDDFGTGYSSLSYLYNLPADYLKIDQSFVGNMQPGDRNYKIVQAVVSLSDQLQLAAIAEGIETEQQLTWLNELGCELGQGYLLAHPLAPKAATELLAMGRTLQR